MNNRGVAATIVVALAAVSLTSCKRGVRILIDGPIGEPALAFHKMGPGWASACMSSVIVEDVSSREVQWAISSGLDCIEVEHMRYGTAPEGFEVIMSAKALRADRVYSVSASGAGWGGELTFRYEAGRYVLD